MFIVLRREGDANFEGDVVKVYNILPDSQQDESDITWVDMHVSAAAYKIPDPDEVEPWLPFENSKKGEKKFIKLDSGCSATVQTVEAIKTNGNVTGIVVGSAGRSLRGLLVTPGKIDPHFGAQSIALNIQNGSDRPIYIQELEKIAVVGFIAKASPVGSG